MRRRDGMSVYNLVGVLEDSDWPLVRMSLLPLTAATILPFEDAEMAKHLDSLGGLKRFTLQMGFEQSRDADVNIVLSRENVTEYTSSV